MLVLHLGSTAFSAFPPNTVASPHQSITRASGRVGGSPDLPLSDVKLRAVQAVEQVHISGGSADGLFVTWATNSTGVAAPSILEYTLKGSGSWSTLSGPPGTVLSTLMDPRFPAVEGGCEGSANYTTPSCFYTSPTIHNIALPALSPGEVYEYRVGGRTFEFRAPPSTSSDSVTFGVVGDLGQTLNSTATIAGLLAAAKAVTIDTLLHAGDLSYADGNGYRWDSYGRLIEPLASMLPVAHAGGNHEVSNGGENWVAYAQRYPNNHAAVASESYLWYSFESGPAHVVVLCSYADSHAGSSQYLWLQHDLAQVDRAKTPWGRRCGRLEPTMASCCSSHTSKRACQPTPFTVIVMFTPPPHTVHSDRHVPHPVVYVECPPPDHRGCGHAPFTRAYASRRRRQFGLQWP